MSTSWVSICVIYSLSIFSMFFSLTWLRALPALLRTTTSRAKCLPCGSTSCKTCAADCLNLQNYRPWRHINQKHNLVWTLGSFLSRLRHTAEGFFRKIGSIKRIKKLFGSGNQKTTIIPSQWKGVGIRRPAGVSDWKLFLFCSWFVLVPSFVLLPRVLLRLKWILPPPPCPLPPVW